MDPGGLKTELGSVCKSSRIELADLGGGSIFKVACCNRGPAVAGSCLAGGMLVSIFNCFAFWPDSLRNLSESRWPPLDSTLVTVTEELSDAVLGLPSSSRGGNPLIVFDVGLVVSPPSATAESDVPPVVRLLEVDVFHVRPE